MYKWVVINAKIGLFKLIKENQLEMSSKEETRQEHTIEFTVLTMFLHQSLTDTLFPINLIGMCPSVVS
jgi:hypothetical protein